MLRTFRALPGALVLMSSVSVVAQAPVATIVAAQSDNVLRAGTPVALKMAEGLTTEGKRLKVGQRFQMEVAEPIELNGQVVIPNGSPATGEVTEVRNKGMWGKSGHVTVRALYVRANGRQIRLTGGTDDKGVTGTGAVVGALVVMPVVGFFVTGTSAQIPMGAPVKAFLDEDVTVAFSNVAPPPMVVSTVPVSTPAATPAPIPASAPAVPTAEAKPL